MTNSPESANIFPINRNTLTIDFIENAINALIRKLINPKDQSKRIRHLRLRSRETNIFSTPIIEFLNLLDLIRIFARREKPSKTEFIDEIKKFEKEVLDGEIIFKNSKELEKKEIKYVLAKSKKEIDIISASSMIQQISSFILFLKYFFRRNCLIIIDEPESNLHPNAQLKFIELLAFLINNGFYIIITTHTPYIIDHINNLIYGYKIYSKLDSKSKKDFPIDKRILLNPNDISAYLFQKEGNTKSIIYENQINWDTFGDITDKLNEYYEKIRDIEEKFKIKI